MTLIERRASGKGNGSHKAYIMDFKHCLDMGKTCLMLKVTSTNQLLAREDSV